MKAGRFALVVQRKLKSRQGASLSIALLIFLLCATVGSVVLAAANTSFGTLVNKNTEDQRRYTLVSAAEAFRDEGEKFELQVSKSTDGSLSIVDSGTDVNALMNAVFNAAVSKAGTSGENKKITISLDYKNSDGKQAMEDVTAFIRPVSVTTYDGYPEGSYSVTFIIGKDAVTDEKVRPAVTMNMTATRNMKTVSDADGNAKTVCAYIWNCDRIEVRE